MGKLVVSGSGQGNKAIAGWAIFYLVSAISSFILAFMLGRDVRVAWGWEGPRTVVERNGFWWFFIVFGIVELILIPLIGSAISNTRIDVHENGVTGNGISKWFYFGDIRSFDFMLTFNEVSIDVNGEQIVVHGPGTHYKVYCQNAFEIRQAIYAFKTGTPRTSAPQMSKNIINVCCERCKKEYDEGRNSCPHCAYRPPQTAQRLSKASNTWQCSGCDEKNPTSSRICRGCGKNK